MLVLGLLSALLAVALNLARLYISPAVLAVLEKQASLTELLKTIGGFVLVTLLLSAAAAYVDVQNHLELSYYDSDWNGLAIFL